MGFKDEEVDVFDLSAVPKPEDYGTETNMFAVDADFDVSEGRAANRTQAARPPVFSSSFDDDEGEFDDDFPGENEGFFSKIKGMFAKPDIDDDIDDDIDFDASGDFSDDGDFPEEKEGFISKIKGMFAKPEIDDADIDTDIDLDDGDIPEENGGFFSKIKGMFAKPDIDDDFDELPDFDDDDYTPVSGRGGDSGVFELSSPAAPQAEPAFEDDTPEFEEVNTVFEAAEPGFEAVGAAPQPFVVETGVFEKAEDEFDLSANVPPPPAPAPLPPPVFNRIAHVCLHVKNLDASVDFYAKLGFTKRFSFNKNGRLFGVYLDFGGGNFIELFEDAGSGSGAKQGGMAHFCLETPNIDAAIESLNSRGIEHTPKKLGGDSTYQIWLKDPDGNDFEIHQYTSGSSQFTGKDVEADW